MSAAPEPRSGWLRRWGRRALEVLVSQLRQGITPERIALTMALGAVISVFPVFGSTTLLCGLVALWLRLNQPVIQLVNWACAPLQVILIIPFYRAGEWLGAPHLQLSIPQLFERFRAGPLRFIADFATIALGGVAVWILLAPAVVAALYFGLRAPLRAMAATRTRVTSAQ